MVNNICTKEYQRVTLLAAKAGCMLVSSGCPVNIAERAMSAVCTSYGAQSVCIFCVPDAIAVSARFKNGEYTSLNRVYYGGNNLYKQEKCFSLVRQIAGRSVDLTEAERRLEYINSTSGASLNAQITGSMLACGAFAVFFGGNAADGIIAAIAGLVTSLISARLSRRGSGGCARVFLLSFVSGMLAVILCTLLQLIGVTCHTSIALVGTLMTLIPGLAVCNALSDIISGEIFSGAYRILYGLAQTVCITAGYAVALTISGSMTAFTIASPRADVLHITICYISGAIGAAGFCLTMNAKGKRLLYGVSAAMVCYTAYVVSHSLGATPFVCYFLSAVAAYASAQLPTAILKIPSAIFITPAVIPVLPGASLYFAVNALVCGDIGTALACGTDALVIFTAIAAGLAAAELAQRLILPKSINCFK